MENYTNIQEFNKLFYEYHLRFIRFAMGYVENKQTAEDIVSEAFAAYWENRPQLSNEINIPSYILTIVKNKCLNQLKREQLQHRVNEELRDHSEWLFQTKISTLEVCDPDFLFSGELQHIINNTLDHLPNKTRQIFLLSRNEELTYNKIATKMNISIKTVEYHISKALDSLYKSLKDFL